MKKALILSISVLLVIIAFTSCNTETKKTQESTSSAETTLQVTSSYNEKSKTKKTVYRDSYGEICRTVIENYDDKGNLLKQSSYTANDKLEGIVSYKYNKDNNIIKTTVYDSVGDVQYTDKEYIYKKTTVDSKETYLLLSYNRFDKDNSLQSAFKYEYDSKGNMKSMKTYSASGALLTENKY